MNPLDHTGLAGLNDPSAMAAGSQIICRDLIVSNVLQTERFVQFPIAPAYGGDGYVRTPEGVACN